VRLTRTTLTMLALLTALAVAWGRPPAAVAQDNTAVAINTKDGASVFKLAFKIVRANKDVVDNANVAFAFGSCTDCQTVAIAFQAVLVFADAGTVTPVNLAWAQNYECTECLAFAWAYQSVFSTGGPVHFTAEGNRRLRDLRQALKELLDSIDGLTADQAPPECANLADALLETCYLEAMLTQYQAEFKDILATELVPAGKHESDEQDEDSSTTDEPGTTTIPPTESSGTETTETETTTTTP
jgi:putative peptide zinc metalloprotease protein